jgi:hypothetical protein
MDRQPKPVAARPRAARGSRLRTPADAAADIDRVVDAYITEVILEENPGDEDGMYWWWPRAAWVDPNQLIVDADDGTLRRVEFSTNDRQEITFAEPIEALEQFVDLAPSAKAHVLVAAAQDTRPRAAMRVFESRDDVPGLPKREPEAGVGDGSNNVGMTPEQLKALGLAEDATTEQINARIAELAALEGEGAGTGGEGSGEPAGGEGTGGEGGTGEGGEPASGEPAGGEGAAPPAAAASADDGFVRVPASEWERVQEGAAAGTKVAAAAETKRRDDTIVAATADGKIAPAAKQSMENLHQRDPDAFYNLLTASVDKGGLMPGVMPVHRQGGAGQEAATAAAAPSPAKMAAMFPEVTFAGAQG